MNRLKNRICTAGICLLSSSLIALVSGVPVYAQLAEWNCGFGYRQLTQSVDCQTKEAELKEGLARYGADKESPAYINLFSALATLYFEECKLAQAEAAFKEILSVVEKTSAADDPATAAALLNLATVYESQARYAEAE